MASWELPGILSSLPIKKQTGETQFELNERRRAAMGGVGGVGSSVEIDLGRGRPPVPSLMAPPASSGAANGGDLRFGPGGATAPDLRTPFGAIDKESGKPRPLIYDITGFDPAWGTPPSRADVGLTWNPDRFVYQPTATMPLSGESRAANSYRQLAAGGVYAQAYRDEATGSSTWRSRYVRVPTPVPTPGRPYVILGEEEDLYGTGEDRRQRESARAAAAARAEAASAAAPGLWTPSGPSIPEPSALAASLWKPPSPPAPKFNNQDYAWVSKWALPFGCPYPYDSMPVPREDYDSGRWLDADYVPSIPLPPPYDQIKWQCGVPSAPVGGKGKPTPTGTSYYTPPETATSVFRPPPDENPAARLAREKAKLRDLQERARKAEKQLASAHTAQDAQRIEAELKGLKAQIGMQEATVKRAQEAADLAKDRADLAALEAEKKEVEKQLAQVGSAEAAIRLKAELDELEKHIRSQESAIDQQERVSAGDTEGYASPNPPPVGPPPSGPVLDPAPEPEPRGGQPAPWPPASPPDPKRGMLIDCDLVLDSAVPPALNKALGQAAGSNTTDCTVAIDMFLKSLDSALKALGPPFDGYYFFDKSVDEHPSATPFRLVLYDKSSKIATPSQFQGFPEMAMLVGLINGNLGDADSRTKPTTIVLVNNTWSGASGTEYILGRDTNEPIDAGVTPSQERANGTVYWNVDARKEYEKLIAGSIYEFVKNGGSSAVKDPLNPLVSLFNELTEHNEMDKLALADKKAHRPAIKNSAEDASNMRKADAESTLREQALQRELGSPERIDGGFLYKHEMPNALSVRYRQDVLGKTGRSTIGLQLGVSMDAQGNPTRVFLAESDPWPADGGPRGTGR